MTHYKFLIGFVCGLFVGLVPPLILLRSDNAAVERMTAKFASNDPGEVLSLPAPPASQRPSARIIQIHDITGIEATWKGLTPPAGSTVIYVGLGKGVQLPDITVADDRMVVVLQATAAGHQELATQLGTTKPAPSPAPAP